MILQNLRRRLGQLRSRERLLRAFWGLSRWVVLVLAALGVACLIDYGIDRLSETPQAVRWALSGLLAVVAVFGLAKLCRPLFARLPDDQLALWVEEKHPHLQHRLITVVQMHRESADLRGVSTTLVEVVGEEARQHTESISFPSVADHGRVKRGLLWLLPALVVAGALFAWKPALVGTLVARQFGADIEVPRRVKVEPLHAKLVRPAGERLVLEFKVQAADLDPDEVGAVWVRPTNQPTDAYELKFDRKAEDGSAIYAAEVVGANVDLEYWARVDDGRTKQASRVSIVPRPAVNEQHAKLLLPSYCGLTPNGQRYEVAQSQGDVMGIPGSTAAITIKTQKPIKKAWLQLLGPAPDATPKQADDAIPEIERRMVAMTVDKEGNSASGMFDLKADETSFRIHVEDEHGFRNQPAPRRSVRLIPEESPQVTLLRDLYLPTGKVSSDVPLEDFEVDGMPLVVGWPVRVIYYAAGPYGLGQAWFLYRIQKGSDSSGGESVEEEKWIRVPLVEVKGSDKTGPFDFRRGAFLYSPESQAVDFYAAPSNDPEKTIGRTQGGGRYIFHTKKAIDLKGQPLAIKEGDRIEYCIEVFADKNGGRSRPVARSEVRTQLFVDLAAWMRWEREVRSEETRIRQIDAKQRGLYSD
jgi:hypothetical protein